MLCTQLLHILASNYSAAVEYFEVDLGCQSAAHFLQQFLNQDSVLETLLDLNKLYPWGTSQNQHWKGNHCNQDKQILNYLEGHPVY